MAGSRGSIPRERASRVGPLPSTLKGQPGGGPTFRIESCSSARAILQPLGILDAEILVDLPRRVRAVEGVEVEAADLVVEQVATLLGRPVDTDLADSGRVVGTTA